MSTIDPPERPAGVTDPESAVLDAAARAVEPLEQAVEMTPLDFPRRLLLVHAHPDDESISCGATMAKYAAEGALVTLVTCTLGEEGEVVVPELAHLAADKEDALGPRRIEELASACEALGVTDHRFLGGPGRWRDSGMMGEPTNSAPGCFWQADLDEATRELVAIMRGVRPQVVVTYDENGAYGHPDHIQAHRVAVAALEAAADPERWPEIGEPWAAAKLYYTAMPRSVIQQGIDLMRERGESLFEGLESAADVPFAVDDDVITAEVDARDHLDAKMAALRAHASQISVDGPFFALADDVGQRAFGREYFVLARGDRGPGTGEHDWEPDLFAGL